MTNALYSVAPNRIVKRGNASLFQLQVMDLSPEETDDMAAKVVAALNAYGRPAEPETGPVTRFMDLAVEARQKVVAAALDTVLRGLVAPVGTTEIVRLIETRITVDHWGLDNKAAAWIKREAVGLALSTPEAQRSGETFQLYGRTMHRWVWSPRE